MCLAGILSWDSAFSNALYHERKDADPDNEVRRVSLEEFEREMLGLR